MVKRSYLFIEGTRDVSNGNLREGFSTLLENKLKGKMLLIVNYLGFVPLNLFQGSSFQGC
jgi:hypothetical protein